MRLSQKDQTKHNTLLRLGTQLVRMQSVKIQVYLIREIKGRRGITMLCLPVFGPTQLVLNFEFRIGYDVPVTICKKFS